MPDLKSELPATPAATSRLTLRRAVLADAPFFLELLNEPAFHANIGDRGVRTADDAARYLAEKYLTSYERHGFGLYVVELKTGGGPVGICGLVKRDFLEHPDLGFAFLQRHWSQGYAVEAATETVRFAREGLDLAHLYGVVAPQNAKSIRLLTKLGLSFVRPLELPGNSAIAHLYGMSLRAGR